MLQLDIATRTAKLAATLAAIGASPTLEIRTGVAPAACTSPDTGTLLATFALPSTWMDTPTNGVVVKAGGWPTPTAVAGGVASHYRIKAGGACRMQGQVGMNSGDLYVDSVPISSGTVITNGQVVQVVRFTLTEGNS